MTRVNKVPRHRPQQLPVGYLEILFSIERLDVHVRARSSDPATGTKGDNGIGNGVYNEAWLLQKRRLYLTITRREISFEA